MCRNIRTLYNTDPSTTPEEVHSAALQYVRKITGYAKPSAANAEAFERAVAEIAHISEHLLADLVTSAPPRDRAADAARARERSATRYAVAAPPPGGQAPSASATA